MRQHHMKMRRTRKAINNLSLRKNIIIRKAPIDSFQSRNRLVDLEGKYLDHLSKELNKGISEQNASFGHLYSILSINSATKCCKNT